MAFNVGNFIKDTAKSSVDKLIDDAIGKVTSNLPSMSGLLAKSSAQSLFNIGSSYESVQALTSQKVDALVSGSADDFFALAGKVVNRTAGANLSQLRRTSPDNINTLLDKVIPSSKIRQAKNKDSLEIIAVI